jgi:predicted transposase/invertase (TIGR01784 family)
MKTTRLLLLVLPILLTMSFAMPGQLAYASLFQDLAGKAEEMKDKASDEAHKLEDKYRQQGIKQGEQQEREKIARNLLAMKKPVSFVAEVTGLSISQIKALQNGG